MQKVIAIVGPTAVGKTHISIKLAKVVGGEIVSADSRQVYQGLDIGTGKVTAEETEGVPHHLLDVANPQDTFSAADYVERAHTAIADIATRKHTPIIVGGTGFYIDSLLGRVHLADVPPNLPLRARLKDLPTERLLKKLARLDIHRASTIDGHNRVRLVRAIEVASAGISTKQKKLETKHYSVLWLGVTLPKEALEKNIHTRLLTRMDQGLLEEVINLHTHGLSYERMEELGLEYRYLARHLQGKLSREEMLTTLESEIRKYAKRQMTWFKRNKDIKWFSPAQTKEIVACAKRFLKD